MEDVLGIKKACESKPSNCPLDQIQATTLNTVTIICCSCSLKSWCPLFKLLRDNLLLETNFKPLDHALTLEFKFLKTNIRQFRLS